uniref:Uncharacterized protein n=1 Tax=Arundo donax TaxID=35708 RepID=A0A0A8ZBA0_ARUDO
MLVPLGYKEAAARVA